MGKEILQKTEEKIEKAIDKGEKVRYTVKNKNR